MTAPATVAARRISLAAKQGILNAGPLVPRANGHAAKLERAIAWLGTKYVCHKVNRVPRLAEPLPEFPVWKPRTLKGKK